MIRLRRDDRGTRRTPLLTGITLALGAALGVSTALAAGPAAAASDAGHGSGRMGPESARTVTVDPATGPDFEMPFTCGQSWTGSSRASHSPSAWTVDWNTPDDLGKPALASAPGVVTLTRSLTTSYGRYVVVDHGNGWTTLYAHLNAIVATVGQVVDQGDLIGYVGSSGGSTGPHLHFEERLGGAYFAPWFTRTRWIFGATAASGSCGDRPLAGDWDGDGKDEPGVWRPTATGGRFLLRAPAGKQTIAWGRAGDTPVVGDFDGDGTSQVGTRGLGSSSWQLRGRTGATATVAGLGTGSDAPLSGDWNGDGRAELGWYRWSSHTFVLRRTDGTLKSYVWGQTGEQPVVGDWDGNGADDLGVYRPTTGTWRLLTIGTSGTSSRTVTYGGPGELPVVGDWDGDGTDDLGTWRSTTAKFSQRLETSSGSRSTLVGFGLRRG
ncbi:Peptidase family M23 [Nocardioides scoriae]|uniref:Peptidase family M23 n=1 Tax=Nocardioides scoriae TaxID=642780 RepID=A0A1H1Q2I1_9ACTN|nr:VCBS repeat domain-containing M23 family metallopeptidase [Nocardioides scoriae]SDS17189.1 Peptidase family M23 [Nocardioides scoriae]